MAIDWKSNAEIAKDGDAFNKLIHVILGVYIWEWFTTLDFDYEHLSGKRGYRWPMIFYFANRYLLLFALIGIAIALNVTSEVNCQALYTFNQVLGNAAVGLSSINLSLRTIAVWDRSRYIVIPLVCMLLGHWALLMQGTLLKANWDPVQQACIITQTKNVILAASFIMSMTVDSVVTVLTAGRLLYNRPPGTTMSRLVKLVFRDGIIYFIIAAMSNILATTFMIMDLNPVMSIIGNVPSAITCTIVACRLVRRLNEYATPSDSGFQSSLPQTRLAFRTETRPKITVPTGVHIQMETFQDSSSCDFTPNNSPDTHKANKLDDVEAQGVVESKHAF